MNMSDEEFVQTSSGKVEIKPAKSIYLVTYSQADLTVCSSREKFAEIICAAFNRDGGESVEQWVCCAENHSSYGVHFHMALKLKQKRRFARVREQIDSQYKIKVHFREWITFYYDAYTYVTKQDVNYITSPGHPPLSNSPATRKAVQGKRRSHEEESDTTTEEQGKKSKKKARPRLDMGELFNIVIKNKVKNDLDLCALSKTQLQEGKTDLNRYIMGSTEKQRAEMIRSCWKVETSHDVVARASKTRLQLLADAKAGEHAVENCGWLNAALQVLQFNHCDVRTFTKDVYELLELGRGKGRCIMIHGEKNRAKSFLFMPLMEIYNTFMCPAENKFNWVGAWAKEVIFLNDLNYTEELMAWGSFLNLLEGAPVAVAVPKNHYAEDVSWKELTPVFATAARPIVKIAGKNIDHVQTEMMDARWKMYNFKHEFDDATRVYYEPCGKCFATLVLDYSS